MSDEQSLPVFPSGRDEALGEGQDYATWAQRLGPFLLDFVVVFVVTVALARVFGFHTPFNVVKLHTVRGVRHREPIGSKLTAWFLCSSLVGFVYATALLSSRMQATLGMRVGRLTIGRLNSDAEVHLGVAAYRSGVFEGAAFVCSLLPLGFVIILVDLLWPLWDEKHRTVHDRIAGTVVRRSAGRD